MCRPLHWDDFDPLRLRRLHADVAELSQAHDLPPAVGRCLAVEESSATEKTRPARIGSQQDGELRFAR